MSLLGFGGPLGAPPQPLQRKVFEFAALVPTPSARALHSLHRAMRLTAKQVEEWFSPCEDGEEDFHFAWAEYKSELRMSNPERYF